MLSIPAEAAERFPDLAVSLEQAHAVLTEAEAHYSYMCTMRAEDEYIARSREEGGYSLAPAPRIREAREHYRADLAAARSEYQKALQLKTDAHAAFLNAAGTGMAAAA